MVLNLIDWTCGLFVIEVFLYSLSLRWVLFSDHKFRNIIWLSFGLSIFIDLQSKIELMTYHHLMINGLCKYRTNKKEQKIICIRSFSEDHLNFYYKQLQKVWKSSYPVLYLIHLKMNQWIVNFMSRDIADRISSGSWVQGTTEHVY